MEYIAHRMRLLVAFEQEKQGDKESYGSYIACI